MKKKEKIIGEFVFKFTGYGITPALNKLLSDFLNDKTSLKLQKIYLSKSELSMIGSDIDKTVRKQMILYGECEVDENTK